MGRRSQNSLIKKKKAQNKRKKKEEKFEMRLERAKQKKEDKENGVEHDLIDYSYLEED